MVISVFLLVATILSAYAVDSFAQVVVELASRFDV